MLCTALYISADAICKDSRAAAAAAAAAHHLLRVENGNSQKPVRDDDIDCFSQPTKRGGEEMMGNISTRFHRTPWNPSLES